jgi:surfeit locus 1 family protein
VIAAASSTRSSWRSLLAPGLATLIALAILIGLGKWQLERKAWKESVIAQIQARAFGPPSAIAPPASWPTWRAEEGEFRRVRVTGTFLHDLEAAVHGLAPGERGAPRQGFYLFTPLRLVEGGTIMVNRGFVPTELRDPAKRPGSQPAGDVAVTGLVRAPETKGWFVPDDKPAENQWFRRDPAAIAAAKGLTVAPFYVAADETPNPGGWPQGGQTTLNLPNNHLQYAFTWFGIAATLVGVFGAFAWRRLQAAELG